VPRQLSSFGIAVLAIGFYVDDHDAERCKTAASFADFEVKRLEKGMVVVNRRLGDYVERVVILKRTRGGGREIVDVHNLEPRYDFDDEGVQARVILRDRPGVLYVDKVLKKPRKKQFWLLRPFERQTRRRMVRNIKRMRRYLELHERSNRKKKNGWVRDYMRNMVKARRSAND
jgi:Family of unknown function (DUF6312)